MNAVLISSLSRSNESQVKVMFWPSVVVPLAQEWNWKRDRSPCRKIVGLNEKSSVSGDRLWFAFSHWLSSVNASFMLWRELIDASHQHLIFQLGFQLSEE